MASSSFSSSKYFWCAKDRLGDGKTSKVFAGYRRDNGSQVAVKMFGPNVDFNAVQREIHAVEAIKDHENIVKLFDVEEERKTRVNVIVMELCSGGSLYDILESPVNGYGLREAEFKQLISDVANGLAHLRQCKFSHRDIKPKNIMKFEKPDGTYVFKLADFGTARELEDDETFKSMCGTPQFLHPAVHGGGVANAKVDLWSVGATFFHAATGREPFICEDQQRLSEIKSTKESGVLYGWQLEPNGDIKYGKVLPPDTQISRGLRALMEPILAKLIESDFHKMMSFEHFFGSVRAIVQKKVVDVFCVYSCSLHKIYIDPEEPDGVQALKRMIHKEAGIDPIIQELFYENLPYLPRELVPASKLPITTPDSPFIVFGGHVMKTAELENPIHVLPTIPQVPKGYAIANDIQFGKECCKSVWAYRLAAENLDRLYMLMHQVALCYGHTLKHEYQLLEQLLHSVEQVNSATCKVLSSQIAGLNHQAQLTAALVPATNALVGFLKQETAAKEDILGKIQGVLPPLKQKINDSQIKLEASSVSDMWDPLLGRDVFHRGVDVLQYLVQCVESSYKSMRRKVKMEDGCELDAHELTKSKLHGLLVEAREKVICLNIEKDRVYQKQAAWLLRCSSLCNDISNIKKKLVSHFEDCNRHLLDLEQWEKTYVRRIQKMQGSLSVAHDNALSNTPLPPVQAEPIVCPSSQTMSELQKTTVECSKTVALQKTLLVTLTDLIKSLSEVSVIPDHN